MKEKTLKLIVREFGANLWLITFFILGSVFLLFFLAVSLDESLGFFMFSLFFFICYLFFYYYWGFHHIEKKMRGFIKK